VRSTRPKVLIVDDDPSHLEIYSLLLTQAGYSPVCALVRFAGAEFPAEGNIDGIILDSRLNSVESSSDLARQMRARYPHAPILLLCDVHERCDGGAGDVACCVRRGEPADLLGKLSNIIKESADPEPILTCGCAQ